jgi:hypothetical protein
MFMKSPKVEFKGIVRGGFSQFQQVSEAEGWADKNPSVFEFVGESIESVLQGLCIEEWIFTLKVNGKRIKSPIEYIRRKGLNVADFMREGVAA